MFTELKIIKNSKNELELHARAWNMWGPEKITRDWTIEPLTDGILMATVSKNKAFFDSVTLEEVPDPRPDTHSGDWELNKKGDVISLYSKKGDYIDSFSKEYCRLRGLCFSEICENKLKK